MIMNTMNKKNVAIFSGALLIEAIAVSWIATQTASHDDLMILLFPGLVGMAFGGVNVQSVLVFLGITVVTYAIGGLVLTLMYAGLQKMLPPKFAFLVTLIIPALILSGIVYSQDKKNREYVQQHAQQSPTGGVPVTVYK